VDEALCLVAPAATSRGSGNNHCASFRSHTLLSWKAAPPNGAIESAPVSVLMPRPSA
jgi:hypothetical protein